MEQDQLARARRCRQALDRTYSLSPFISGCVSEHAIHSSFRVCRRRDAVEVGRSLPRRDRAWNYSSQQIQGRPRLLVGGPKLRPPLLPPSLTRLKAAKPRSRQLLGARPALLFPNWAEWEAVVSFHFVPKQTTQNKITVVLAHLEASLRFSILFLLHKF